MFGYTNSAELLFQKRYRNLTTPVYKATKHSAWCSLYIKHVYDFLSCVHPLVTGSSHPLTIIWPADEHGRRYIYAVTATLYNANKNKRQTNIWRTRQTLKLRYRPTVDKSTAVSHCNRILVPMPSEILRSPDAFSSLDIRIRTHCAHFSLIEWSWNF